MNTRRNSFTSGFKHLLHTFITTRGVHVTVYPNCCASVTKEDGNIVLALEPGVVVALDSNGDSNNRRKYNGL